MNSFCMPCGPASSLTSCIGVGQPSRTERPAAGGLASTALLHGTYDAFSDSSIGVGIAVLSIVIFIAYYRPARFCKASLRRFSGVTEEFALDPYQVRSPVYFRARCGGALHDEPSMNSTTTTPSSSLANGIARLDRGLNAAPHILNADGKPLFLTGPDYDRDPLKGDYLSF